eukprot:gene8985-6743_t
MICIMLLATTAAPPPNILFFLADDMGYGDAGYLATGNPHGKLLTPNLDIMVGEGMSFTDAYAGAPVCAPSRCTLITGRHSDVGFASVFKANGYHTRHIGKWGLGGWTSGGSPLDKGFEHYYGQLDQGYCHNYYPYLMDFGVLTANGTHNTSQIPIEANQHASEENCGDDRLLCRWSGDLWTEQSNASTQPWLLYLSYTAPHAGGIGPYEKNATALGKEIGYASAVTEIDSQLGLVLASIESAGIAASTVVFFASDNGASNEGNHNYGFFSSHEGGHRSPLVVRWPGQIEAGARTNRQFAFYDFFATALELAGLSPSAHLPANATDGDSIAATLLGKTQPEKAFVYHEYCGPSESKKGWGQALRVGNMSGVCLGADLSSGWPVCTTSTFLFNPTTVAAMLAQMKTVRFPGGYCGEPMPTPPAPPPGPPLPLSYLKGTWDQGKAKDAVEITVPSGSTATFAIGTVGHCCMWKTGTGVMDPDGHTLHVDATG